jgi:hypothetical protein
MVLIKMLIVFLLFTVLISALFFITTTDTKFLFAPGSDACPRNTKFSNGRCIPYGLALAKLKKIK